jgi:hypothetical protein
MRDIICTELAFASYDRQASRFLPQQQLAVQKTGAEKDEPDD